MSDVTFAWVVGSAVLIPLFWGIGFVTGLVAGATLRQSAFYGLCTAPIGLLGVGYVVFVAAVT